MTLQYAFVHHISPSTEQSPYLPNMEVSHCNREEQSLSNHQLRRELLNSTGRGSYGSPVFTGNVGILVSTAQTKMDKMEYGIRGMGTYCLPGAELNTP